MLKRMGQIGLIVLLTGFLLGLGRFAYLRFSSGELYPEYSSLRADPMGTKALFESLQRVGGYEVTRRVHTRAAEESLTEGTIFMLGAFGLAESQEMAIEGWAKAGARVVVGLNGGTYWLWAEAEEQQEQEEETHNKPDEEEPMPAEEGETRGKGIFKDLKAKWSKAMIEAQLAERLVAVRADRSEADLPEKLFWAGIAYFELPEGNDGEQGWQVVYTANEQPVVIEQRVGLGKVILAADSFLFSNEALLRERSPEFLLWAAGPQGQVVFDETHLGVEKGSSIMVALREYGLEGLFLGFIVTASLWVWKSGSSFVPPYRLEEESDAESVEGKTAREGVIHLLQRNIAPEDLPGVSLAEWKKSHPNLNQFDASRLHEAERILEAYHGSPRKERNPVETYRLMARALSSQAN